MTIYSSVETGKEKSALTAEDSPIQLMWKPINSNDALGISAALASLILLLIRKRISKYFKEKKTFKITQPMLTQISQETYL